MTITTRNIIRVVFWSAIGFGAVMLLTNMYFCIRYWDLVEDDGGAHTVFAITLGAILMGACILTCNSSLPRVLRGIWEGDKVLFSTQKRPKIPKAKASHSRYWNP